MSATEDLIYSVNRTPERTFDTSRADEVITGDEIRRMNPRGLADLLEERAGIVVSSHAAGGMPFMRGLGGKQVMILIDGVKVNNATYGADNREYLNIIDINQIDRIEVVRGVVSVLGTESLGGVINIITQKGPLDGQTIGGSLAARYATGDSSLSGPMEVFGTLGKLRFNAGATYGSFGDLRAAAGRREVSYERRGGYANGQLLLSPEKTLGFGYQSVSQTDVEWQANPGLLVKNDLQLVNVSYQDLTSRGWYDSLRVAAYWNRQSQRADISAFFEGTHFEGAHFDGDSLGGVNLEMGTFVGSHQFTYGADYTSEKIESWSRSPDTQGVPTVGRGVLMDGAGYRSLGVYVQDRFDLSKWLTVIGGVRYGTFRTSGKETTFLGDTDLDGEDGDVTGALNLIAHVTPSLNVIANVFRGFRAPNLNDTSRFLLRVDAAGSFEIPNPDATAERVISYEGGVRYASGAVSGSAFVYRNNLTNLLAISNVGFADFNENGTREPDEFDLYQNLNVGEATIEGFEVDGRYAVTKAVSMWGHYSKAEGTNTVLDQPLSGVPGGVGAAGIRYAPLRSYAPWVELVWRHHDTQRRQSAAEAAVRPDGIPGFDLVHLRGGMTLTKRLTFTVAVENLLDEDYRPFSQPIEGAGRQFVLGTRFDF